MNEENNETLFKYISLCFLFLQKDVKTQVEKVARYLPLSTRKVIYP